MSVIILSESVLRYSILGEAMNIQLSENIRTFRKERGLTQEQLAEVLGVTVGAVYKWEAGLSVPEITTLVEIADFYDISIDVLLGYEMKDNRRESVLKRMMKSLGQKDMNGLQKQRKLLRSIQIYLISYTGVESCI